MKKFQTATEYLVILAVVIIIGVIVIVALGGIPGLGGLTGSRSESTALASGPIGILSYSVREDAAIIEVRNNQIDTVTLTNIKLDERDCVLEEILLPGESRLVTCYFDSLGTVGDTFEFTTQTSFSRLGVNFNEEVGVLSGRIGSPSMEGFDVILPAHLRTVPTQITPGSYVNLLSGNTVIARILPTSTHNQTFNWSELDAGVDTVAGLSFIHAPNYESIGIQAITLFIPASPENNEYYICPNAQSLNDIFHGCPNGYTGSTSEVNGFYHVQVHGTGGADLVRRITGSTDHFIAGSYSHTTMNYQWGFRW